MAVVGRINPDCRFLFKPLDECTPPGGLHIDVWIPTKLVNDAAPLAIFIHGGGFTNGSTHDIGFNQLKYLIDSGFAAVSIEYRLMPHVVHKDIRADQLDAYVWIQNNLNRKVQEKIPTAGRIDTNRCLATGASAGGTSSPCLAADIELYKINVDSTLPSLICTLAAYPLVHQNLHFAQPKSALDKALQGQPEKLAMVQALYNEPVCVSDPYADASVLPESTPRLLWLYENFKAQSLNSFLFGQDPPYPPDCDVTDSLTKSYPPTWLYCALDDQLIPPEQTRIMQRALEKVQVEVHVSESHAPHGFVDSPGRYTSEEVNVWWKESILPSLEWAKEKVFGAEVKAVVNRS